MTEAGEDLKSKYQKLATEYSKVRAQNKVLKSAVLDEQQKGTQIKENLKLKDQSLRRAEQELDSLTFRNQQLTKRLSLLQDDLETLQVKRPNNAETNIAYDSKLQQSVFAEELQGKIQENARLHAQLEECKESHMLQLGELQDKNFLIKQELTQKIEELRHSEALLKEKVSQLKQGQVKLEVNAQQKAKEVESMQEQIQQFQSKGLMNDEQNERGSLHLNLKEQKKVSMKTLLEDLESPIGQLTSGFDKMLTSYSVLLLSSNPSDSEIKILKEEQLVWQNLKSSYINFIADVASSVSNSIKISTLKKVSTVTKSVILCASSLKKLLPILSKKFNQAERKNYSVWKSSIGRFVSCWASMIPHLTTISSTDMKDEEDIHLSIIRSLNLMGEALFKLHSISEELINCWESTSDMNTNLQCIRSSLNQIVSVNKKIVECLNQNAETPSTPSPADVSPINANNVEAQTTSPTQSLTAWSENSNESAAGAGGSEASLAQQLEQAISRLSKLEEEKDHWRLEYQLLSHKRQNESLPQEVFSSAEQKDKDGSVSKTSIVCEVTPNSEENREQEIRLHFTERCRNLYLQHTATTSQAALYQNECDAIMKKLSISEQLREAADEESQSMKKQVSMLQENLQTTSRNYEEQISTMSEHLADLNEKIATQQDTIEQLLYQQKNKKSKK